MARTPAFTALLATAILAVPTLGLAQTAFPYGARIILKPGATFRMPADRSATITARLNGCYLNVHGGPNAVDFVLEAKDEARGLVLLPGESITNLGGTTVKGGHFPAVTCLVSLLMYAAGSGPTPAQTASSK